MRLLLALALLLFPLALLAQDSAGPGPAAAPSVQIIPNTTITNAPTLVAPTVPGAPAAEKGAAPEKQAQGEAQAENTAERNDFQEFINQTLGQKLPLFGYNLFTRSPTTFAPVDNVPVTPDYVIGPGDELVIRAWGQIDVDYRGIVERDGSIVIPRIGPVSVAGLAYRDVAQHLRAAVSRQFRNFELMVTLGQLRSVQIFVVGQARQPGVYTVSSLSTLVNAIFAAGGPSMRGSMRAIQLKRANRVVTEFDLYDLLMRGDKSKDAPILAGDVIYFPPMGPLAAISGGVQNPAIYELKGPTTLAALIDYASGLTTTAQTRRASIERIENRQTRIVGQIALDLGGLARTVKDGDLVSVYNISPKFDNAVTLRGNVAAPLRYPFKEGMRVRDLVPESEALITPDYYERKNLAVRYDTVKQGQIADAVRNLGEEINWDYAVIERQNPKDLSTALIPFNLGRAVLEGDPEHNVPLKAGDVVTVFAKGDVAASVERRTVLVRLEGEFNRAGIYQAEPGETLRQLVARVGGVTSKAYLYGAQFNRESTRKNQEERLKQAIDQLEQDLQRASITRSQSATTPEETASVKQELDTQKALISRLRLVKPTGRIVLEVPPNGGAAQLPDIELEDGDRLVVPARPSMVSVFGTVYNESSFLYRADKTVSDYLSQAGGPRREADKKSIYVIRADGSVVSQAQSGSFFNTLASLHPTPGDAIVVPEDFARTTFTKEAKDWTSILYQFALGAAALKVLKD
jgi:protein involved in polysaccharide export with SLBB domain